MLLPITVISLSWLLNACMDAIDHGKGAQTLGLLWHALKWLSYAIPLGYIMLITGMSLLTAAILTAVLWGSWEVLYYILRRIHFHRFDV